MSLRGLLSFCVCLRGVGGWWKVEQTRGATRCRSPADGPAQQCSAHSRCWGTSLQDALSFANENCICPTAHTSLPSSRQLLGNHCSARVSEHDCFRALVEQGSHTVCYLVASHACHFKSNTKPSVSCSSQSRQLLLSSASFPFFPIYLSLSLPVINSQLYVSQKEYSKIRDFPGCPVVKTDASSGCGCDPWLGNLDPTRCPAWPKNLKEKKGT